VSEYKPDDIIPAEMTKRNCKVVAVIGWGHDWAAYMGPNDWDDERIAQWGDKIGSGEAKTLFPELAQSGLYYRA